MNLEQLKNIVFKLSSNIMRSEGEKIYNSGLVFKINGKKINDIYHIYGNVRNSTKSNELSTHIKIDLLKKKLDGLDCTCDDFKDAAKAGHLFMCSHLTATAYRFFERTKKDNAQVNVKSAENIKPERYKEINLNK